MSIPSESAVIVWDPVQKVQHFIRRATFDTKSPDFGHLVPTPTLPKLPLAEVEDGIFGELDQWIKPKIVEQSRWKFDPVLCLFGCGASRFTKVGSAPGESVRVLHEQKVGGYEVSVLEADDAEALAKWIKDRGYSADPELYQWLTPYVAAKWKITAFKIMQDPKSGKLATTKAVRMSFQTDRPFFPYREPEVNPLKKDGKEKNVAGASFGERLLRVHFISSARMEGKLGMAAWHAVVPWADQLTDEQRRQVARETGIAETDIPANAWLTVFQDTKSPRPGKDEVYFDPAQDQTPIRPVIILYNDIHIPIDCIMICLILVAIPVVTVVIQLRRKKAA